VSPVFMGDKPVAYESGRLPGGAGWLAHPGGLEITLRAIALSGLEHGARILDLGCGSGESIHLLQSRGFDAIGVDEARRSFPGGAGETGLFVEACAEELPFADSSFDGVLAECSLSVMRNPQKALVECARVLRPDGQLMISDLYARNPGKIEAVRRLKGSCVSAMLVREELDPMLQEAGFSAQCFEDHSRALREAAARFILDHESMEELWQSGAHTADARTIMSAMKQVRAGYFLLVATLIAGKGSVGGGRDGR
jgi:arsenite methyltransferase